MEEYLKRVSEIPDISINVKDLGKDGASAKDVPEEGMGVSAGGATPRVSGGSAGRCHVTFTAEQYETLKIMSQSIARVTGKKSPLSAVVFSLVQKGFSRQGAEVKEFYGRLCELYGREP